MTDTFKQHLRKFVDMDEEELEKILTYFTLLEVNKKDNLLVEGDVCRFTPEYWSEIRSKARS